MGDAIISRRGSEYTTINFDGTQAITKVNTFLPFNSGIVYSGATTLGDYAVFGGGKIGSSDSYATNTVFAINTDGLWVRLPNMYTSRSQLAAATAHSVDQLGDTVLFAGGLNSNGDSLDTIEVYYQNFMHDESTLQLPSVAALLTGVSFGDYAIFAGGYYSNTRIANAVAFSANWTRTILSDLNAAGDVVGGARNSNYAVFAGGWASTYTSAVTAYDSTLTKATPSSLSAARNWMASGTVGDYALFVGGETGASSVSNVAEAYDKNLNKLSAANYTWGVRKASAASLGSYLFVAGGMGGANYYNIARYYDSNLVLHDTGPLSHLSINGVAASAGEYAYYYGGVTNRGVYSSSIEVYRLPNKVTVYPGTKYKLGSMQNETTSSTMQTITTDTPISGYIKIKNATIS